MTPFRYCLNASTIRGTPVFRQIEVAAEAGFQGIELWFADTDAYVAGGGRISDIGRALHDSGLEVPTMIYFADWFDCAESDWSRVKDMAERRLCECAALGAAYLICSPPCGPADLVSGARRYAELIELGKSIGVTPAFEFLGFVEQYRTIESALSVLELAGGATILDPFHIFRGGGNVESIAKLRGDQIAVSHFNDSVSSKPREEQHDGDRVMPGDGSFDLVRYCELLRESGYTGWLSLELFREDLWARDPLEVAREGLRKMREVAER